MLFGKENKALPYSANPLEILGIEQAQSFVDSTSREWGGDDACVLRKDDKIQCWGDNNPDGVVTYTP